MSSFVCKLWTPLAIRLTSLMTGNRRVANDGILKHVTNKTHTPPFRRVSSRYILSPLHSHQPKIVFHSQPEFDKSETLLVLLYLHGMADCETYLKESSFAYKNFQNIESNQKSQAKFVSVNYSLDLHDQQTEIFEKVDSDRSETRRHILTHFPVAMGYLTCSRIQSKVHSIIDLAVSNVINEYKIAKDSNVKLVLLGNSLGSVVGMNFIRESRRYSILPVDLFISLGSPINWFLDLNSVSGIIRSTSNLELEENECQQLDSLNRTVADSYILPLWFNLYYPEDFCSGPLRELNESLHKSVTMDIPITSPSGFSFNFVDMIEKEIGLTFASFSGFYVKDERVWKTIEKLVNDL